MGLDRRSRRRRRGWRPQTRRRCLAGWRAAPLDFAIDVMLCNYKDEADLYGKSAFAEGAPAAEPPAPEAEGRPPPEGELLILKLHRGRGGVRVWTCGEFKARGACVLTPLSTRLAGSEVSEHNGARPHVGSRGPEGLIREYAHPARARKGLSARVSMGRPLPALHPGSSSDAASGLPAAPASSRGGGPSRARPTLRNKSAPGLPSTTSASGSISRTERLSGASSAGAAGAALGAALFVRRFGGSAVAAGSAAAGSASAGSAAVAVAGARRHMPWPVMMVRSGCSAPPSRAPRRPPPRG